MGYGAYMRQLLRPLGIYRLEKGNLNHSETEAVGWVLDEVEKALESTEREGRLATAEETLQEWAKLFLHLPRAQDREQLRRAVAALLLIGEGSFTVKAINETICGCGVDCLVEETETYGTVRVSFLGTVGIPEDFEQKKAIIEEIIPCHLAIDWFFLFMTWAICEGKAYTWSKVEKEGHDWESFVLAVN